MPVVVEVDHTQVQVQVVLVEVVLEEQEARRLRRPRLVELLRIEVAVEEVAVMFQILEVNELEQMELGVL